MVENCPYCGTLLNIIGKRKICPNCGIIEEDLIKNEEKTDYIG